MNIRNIFRQNREPAKPTPVEHPLIGVTVTHYRETIPSQALEVAQLISSPAVIKAVKANGNLVLATVTPDGIEEVGEYRQVSPPENYYSRIDRPGNPNNEQVVF